MDSVQIYTFIQTFFELFYKYFDTVWINVKKYKENLYDYDYRL